ncbi:MAG: CPBP family intramembrane metalloprotease [Microscillaceae bacterium]|nr:CPBP family intramembrane metalloprotease [Microscillaceae bacterium]
MKKILHYLKTHLRDDFHYGVYGYTLLFLGLSITFNYYYDFEDSVLDAYALQWVSIPFHILYFAFAYFGVLIPKLWLSGEGHRLREPALWGRSLFFIFLIGLVAGFTMFRAWLNAYTNDALVLYFLYKTLTQLKYLILALPLLWCFYKWFDQRQRSESGFYGLRVRGFEARPYLGMLLIMLPLIVMASFRPDFLKTYPMLKPWLLAENQSGWNPWAMFAVFELSYGAGFIFVELFFRGLLVLGLGRCLGHHAVLPMVVMYAFLHFGKPLGETLGSIAGGYVLGVIALHTRTILGGCFIHIGIAFLMEGCALIQHLRAG